MFVRLSGLIRRKFGSDFHVGAGLALKSEGIGLAVMAELPLVIIDVQRGGPSTGLPTKTEQTDLLQALYGRNGESPVVVVAASTPTDCFDMAFQAAKIALEHMTPVILLTDGFIGNGSSAWRIPEIDEYPEIKPIMLCRNNKVRGNHMTVTKNPYVIGEARNRGIHAPARRIGKGL